MNTVKNAGQGKDTLGTTHPLGKPQASNRMRQRQVDHVRNLLPPIRIPRNHQRIKPIQKSHHVRRCSRVFRPKRAGAEAGAAGVGIKVRDKADDVICHIAARVHVVDIRSMGLPRNAQETNDRVGDYTPSPNQRRALSSCACTLEK